MLIKGGGGGEGDVTYKRGLFIKCVIEFGIWYVISTHTSIFMISVLRAQSYYTRPCYMYLLAGHIPIVYTYVW